MKNYIHFAFIHSDLPTVKSCLLDIFEKREVRVSYGPNKIDVSYAKDSNEIFKLCVLDLKRGCSVGFFPKVCKLQIWKPVGSHGVVLFGGRFIGMEDIVETLNRNYDLECAYATFTLDMSVLEGQLRQFIYHQKERKWRVVLVERNPRWGFFEYGVPLPFEQLEKYSERMIKKRLTNEMLLDYLLALGWDLRSPDFWKSDGDTCYFEWDAW